MSLTHTPDMHKASCAYPAPNGPRTSRWFALGDPDPPSCVVKNAQTGLLTSMASATERHRHRPP